MSSVSQRFVKYGTHAAVSAGVYTWLNPEFKNIKVSFLNGKAVPIWLVAGGMGLAASMLSDATHAWLLPHISSDQRLKHMEASILAPASGAAAYAGVSLLVNPALINQDGDLKSLLMIGAGSELLATWVYENFTSVAIDSAYQDRV